MKQQRGFTLIELIIVIVILGILAVTAAPRFIDVQTDARKSSLSGVAAAIEGGSQLVFAKAAIAGQQGQATATIDLNGTANFAVVYGYPASSGLTNVATLNSFVDINAEDFTVTNADASDGTFVITFGDAAPTAVAANQCQITYTDAPENGTPSVNVQDTGC